MCYNNVINDRDVYYATDDRFCVPLREHYMKIKYLGTGAFEGVPSLFYGCRVCVESRERGGRNLRSRSQALIDNELLIDFNADTVSHCLRYGLDLGKISACLITHSHSDHLYVGDIEIARDCYSHEHATAMFYAARSGYELIKEMTDQANSRADVVLAEEGKRFDVSGGKYTVLPLWADHAPETSPVIYSIESNVDGKRILYANDTGLFPQKTWEALAKEKPYDLVSLDCTGCLGLKGDYTRSHMSMGSCMDTAEKMRGMGLVRADTKIVLNHFSHNGGQTYDEFAPEAEKRGAIAAYDGLELELG